MRKLYLYAHTHWDREWYQPFESFRAQLVSVVRRILDDLDSGKLTDFFLDGQSIIFDDVIEIDPSLRARLEKHMRSGRLTAGPWYVLADQMLVSGESLVRNLDFGLTGTREFGEPTMVGYCPDTFGHTADMPRILNGFGIKTAAVWRGAPLLEMGPAFWWHSPDGSKVLTYHFTRGYYQTAFHDHDGATSNGATEKLRDALLTWVYPVQTPAAARPYYKVLDAALMPVGADHVGPPQRFAETLASLKQRFAGSDPKVDLVVTSLKNFMEQLGTSAGGYNTMVQAVEGELRSNRAASVYERAYLLYGVLSTRLYLKRLNRVAEYQLARVTEPVCALLNAMKIAPYPSGEINHAWKLLLQNHPHDSICGCSVDSVHREMLTRYERISDLSTTLLQSASAALSGPRDGQISPQDPAFKPNGLTLLNLTGAEVSAPVFVEWNSELDEKVSASSELVQIVQSGRVDRLFCGWGDVPYYKEVTTSKGWIWAQDVPSLGLKTVGWPRAGFSPSVPKASVRGSKLTNGTIAVNVPASGRLTVTVDSPGGSQVFRLLHQIRDVADGGDSYNFDPIPGDKPIVGRVVAVKPGQTGPLVASLIVTYEIELPVKVEVDSTLLRAGLAAKSGTAERPIVRLKRSARTKKHQIQTEIILKRNVPIVFFETSWMNHSTDHRLEIVFNTGAPVISTWSENHFSLIRRNHVSPRAKEKLPVEAGHEAEPDRFPCQRFFIANGQIFLNGGMPEYGVDDTSVTMTALRAISWLSKPQLWTRGGGAGPNLYTPEANSLGSNHCSYGWAPLAVPEKSVRSKSLEEYVIARAYQLVELYEGPLWASLTKNDSLSNRSLVRVGNASVRVVAFYKRGEDFVLRLLNTNLDDIQCEIDFDSAAFQQVVESNLACEPGNPIDLGIADGRENEGARRASLLFSKNELKTLLLR